MSGTLPAFIGNLTRLTYLSMGHNEFSGSLPKELGNLKELNFLAIGSNNFSGTLPPELGNLAKLDQLYMDCSGVGGEIPSTFANLQNMLIMWAFDCPLSGKIPDFIGNWTKLIALRFGGNTFQGPIPSSFYNLSSLTVLQITDIYSGSSSLDFIRNMTKLTELSLRNALIIGNIPSNIGEYLMLKTLDLSFNHLTGQITSALFSIDALTNLFVGNNSLSGPLPLQKGVKLQTIDLSYNYLSGTFPSWVTTVGMLLVPGLNCLQRNFHCNNNSPRCFPPTVDIEQTVNIERKKNQTGLIVGIAVTLAILGFILIFLVFYTRMKRENNDAEVLLGMGPKPKSFTYLELASATKDFDPSNKLGEGGFGPVYKGMLSDGRVIAVKQLSLGSNQGKDQFTNEITTITAVQHRNLVKLHGCCIEGTRHLLVYEYHENKSLDQVLFGNRELHLDWPTRFNICLGTARGLAYLHEESRPKIVHRDIKASNILLDTELCPKISDFGLAKLFDDKKTHISTGVAGTIGYLAPEYAMLGHLTEKVDVFSFGVVALEIISGRANSSTNLDREKIYLLKWAWSLHESNQSLGLIDPTLTEFNEIEALRVIGVALLCTQASPMLRPPMSRVVNMLARDREIGPVTSKPSYLTDWDFKDTTNSFMKGDIVTTSSKRSYIGKNSQYDNATDLCPKVDPLLCPVNASQLSDIIADGR
ncbi:probable LRR receptor-like serine/threonine-protein kinase At1g56130 isoform X8 [Pistacia vera]|uniref:probable LRR receptor-like serine/threonine-protein kinase At1g56130 isoform X8 n=1 Tax=Pistacia vera TaxID=55513 RepID=UPI001263786C|nr:probable LRR receptor-like serine/threonine-protein kinase At1g56130 isoform X8 [Pistacia vera]